MIGSQQGALITRQVRSSARFHSAIPFGRDMGGFGLAVTNWRAEIVSEPTRPGIPADFAQAPHLVADYWVGPGGESGRYGLSALLRGLRAFLCQARHKQVACLNTENLHERNNTLTPSHTQNY